MAKFQIVSNFKPTGDQPQAIEKLVAGLNTGNKHQVLLGVTGSGKSVVSKTDILIRSGKKPKIENIGDLIDTLFINFKNKIQIINDTELIFTKDLPKKYQIETLSFDSLTKKPSWKLITQFTRHSSPAFLYKVKTACGREVTVTDDHSLFVVRDGEFKLLESSNLQRSDFIPVPLNIDSPRSPLYNFSLMNYLIGNKYYLRLSNFSEIWKNSEKEIRPLISPAKLHHLIHKNERISLLSYKQLLAVTPRVREGATIGVKAKDYQFPLTQKITPSLMRLLGYYIAEGHSTGDYFIISSADKEIIDDFSASLTNLGLRFRKRPKTYDYQVSSAFWAQVLINLCGRDSKNKHLPPFWMQLSNNQLAFLLRAYFSTDGGVNGDQISCITLSCKLASEIMYALLRFGIVARARKKFMKIPNTGMVGTYWEIFISGSHFLSIFQQKIGFCLREKNNRLIKIIRHTYNTNVDVIPIDGAWVKQVRSKLGLFQRDISEPIGVSRSSISMIEHNFRKPSRKFFQNVIHILKIQATKASATDVLEKIKEKESLLSLFWSPVKAIESVKGEDHVYDLAVEDNETFLAGFGGMFVHNTFTMANVIQAVQKPTLIISHNKTLAGQLAQEFRSIFPKNAVEYFVSYYDYYQPEAYIPQSDTYIEKETQINDEIEKLRLSATTSLVTRRDVVVVASVSAIYNLGSPKEYIGAVMELKEGVRLGFETVMKMLQKMFYTRNDIDFKSSTYRVKGDTLDIYPSYSDQALRLQFLGDKIEKLSFLDPLTGAFAPTPHTLTLYPAKHYITPEARLKPAIKQIEKDLVARVKSLESRGKLFEAQRIEQRTRYDLEMIKQYGYCNGIENYSRYFEGRNPGEPPFTLMEYFPKDFLLIIDESHITLPQIRGMYNGDRSRKETLVEFGFRLPSALDNRPLKFDEFQRRINQAIYVSATPDEYELSLSRSHPEGVVASHLKGSSYDGVAEQLIRPTGILDPKVTVRKTEGQIPDVIQEIEKRVASHERVLVTTLTKRMAEDLTDYLKERNIKVNYLHSDIETLKRSDILESLRLGEYDVIVGINLLREGLDLPEVSLVIILDADKEGFLRSRTSLVQTMGRAARHIKGEVIMYADTMTKSMKAAIDEVERRRKYQEAYNKKHKITPVSIQKDLRERLIEKVEELEEKLGEDLSVDKIPAKEREKMIKILEEQMNQAAAILDFEEAARIRDQIKELKV